MTKMNSGKKLVDRKISLARLRTLSAQTLEKVVGGDDFTFTRTLDRSTVSL